MPSSNGYDGRNYYAYAARSTNVRSKAIRLRQDYMTAAQPRKENGPIMTYKMNEPMTFDELKAMPKDLRREYIKRLIKEMNASSKMIAQMLGIGYSRLKYLAAGLGIEDLLSLCKKGKRTEKQMELWDLFIGHKVYMPDSAEVEMDAEAQDDEDVYEEEPAELETEDTPEPEPTPTKKPSKKQSHMRMYGIRASFAGPYIREDIDSFLRLATAGNDNVVIQIRVSEGQAND